MARIGDYLDAARGRFVREERGSVAVMFAGSLLALTLTVGAAIDYSQAARIRGHMNGALDAAALVAARELSLGERDADKIRALARAQFEANFRLASSSKIEFTGFEVVPNEADNTVGVSAEVSVPTAFMGLAGIDTVPVSSTSVASIDGTRVEIAMMLDLTGSMGDTVAGGSQRKIKDLEAASKSLVDTLLPAGTDVGGKVRIALAPFSEGVNPGPYLKTVTGVAKPATNCVVERTGAEAATDTAPDLAPVPLAPVARMGGSFYCLSKTIQPLTDDRATLVSALTSLPTGGYTAGHLGTAWAQYLLSPKWGSVFTGDAKPAAYGGNVRKIAILMTDGLYNTYYDIGTPPKYASKVHEQTARSAAAAIATCNRMKDAGIVVYTIGFDLTGPGSTDAKATLKACASTVDGALAFFDAADGAELRAAYGEIANRILNLRLSS